MATIITGQVIIPILILVSIVGLSFAYVGSTSTTLPSSPASPPSPSQPWLGISTVEVTPQNQRRQAMKKPLVYSCFKLHRLVQQTEPDKGGNNLKVIDGTEIPVDGDVITWIDGNTIQNLDDFRNYLKNKQVGDNVEFTLASANDNIRTVNTKLEARPS